jgi:hypothetical protein
MKIPTCAPRLFLRTAQERFGHVFHSPAYNDLVIGGPSGGSDWAFAVDAVRGQQDKTTRAKELCRRLGDEVDQAAW